MQTQTPSPLARVPQGAPAGIAIIVASLVTLISIAHHPTIGHRLAPSEAIPALIASSGSDRIVHAVVIATMLATIFGFAVYSLRRGLHRSAVIGAFIAFAFGVATTLGAALIDGFLIPEIASQFAGASVEIIEQVVDSAHDLRACDSSRNEGGAGGYVARYRALVAGPRAR